MKHGEKNYELLYTECSRLTCTAQKEKYDEVKLWRETNDGLVRVVSPIRTNSVLLEYK